MLIYILVHPVRNILLVKPNEVMTIGWISYGNTRLNKLLRMSL